MFVPKCYWNPNKCFLLFQPERVEKIVIEDMLVRKCPKQTIHTAHLYVSMWRQAMEKAPSGITEDEVKMFIAQFLKANMPPHLVSRTPQLVSFLWSE